VVNNVNQAQIHAQMGQLKKIAEKTTNSAVNVYIIMALRQLVKVLTLNEHNRFKIWRVNKAIACICIATQLPKCVQEEKNELTTIIWQLEKIALSMT